MHLITNSGHHSFVNLLNKILLEIDSKQKNHGRYLQMMRQHIKYLKNSHKSVKKNIKVIKICLTPMVSNTIILLISTNVYLHLIGTV